MPLVLRCLLNQSMNTELLSVFLEERDGMALVLCQPINIDFISVLEGWENNE